jgi:hypothetical protein
MTAAQLRSDLEQQVPPPAVRAGVSPPAQPSQPSGADHTVDGEQVAPWLLDDLQGKSSTPVVPIQTPGQAAPGADSSSRSRLP